MNKEREQLALYLSGRSIAEIEIEARRDAHENGFDAKQNPYQWGSFPSLVYTDECQKHFFAGLAANG